MDSVYRQDVPCIITSVSSQDSFGGSGLGTCTDPEGIYPPQQDETISWSNVVEPVGSTVVMGYMFLDAFDRVTVVTEPTRVYAPARTQTATTTVTVHNINSWMASSEEFLKIRRGMTLAQVRHIFGQDGTLESTSSMRWYAFADGGLGLVDEFHVGFADGRVAASFRGHIYR
jgi:hypothetical protein